MISVLMIDDDVEFCSMLRDFLAPYGIGLEMRHDGASGVAALNALSFDLVLLDLMLPDCDGLDVLTQIQECQPTPVLVLSAEGSEASRIAGLDRGADDYLPKPFNPRELVARMHAILRRLEPRSARPAKSQETLKQSNGLTVNLSTRQAFFHGKRLLLTGVEFDLLSEFANSPGMVLERELLVARVFHRPFNPMDRSLDMHVSRLRRKLSSIGEFGDPIKTIRSSGYLFSLSPLTSSTGYSVS